DARLDASKAGWPDWVASAAEPFDVGQKGELPGPLDRGAQLPLVSGAGPGQAAGQDLAPLSQESLERTLVLVVHDPNPRLTDRAGLLRPPHSSSSSSPLGAATGTGWAPSFTTTRKRSTDSSSLTARSNSGSAAPSVSNLATT